MIKLIKNNIFSFKKRLNLIKNIFLKTNMNRINSTTKTIIKFILVLKIIARLKEIIGIIKLINIKPKLKDSIFFSFRYLFDIK